MPSYIVVRHAVDNISPKVAYITNDNIQAEIMKSRLNDAVQEVLNLKNEIEDFVVQYEKNKPLDASDDVLKQFRKKRTSDFADWLSKKVSPLAFKLYINAGEATYHVEVVEEELLIW